MLILVGAAPAGQLDVQLTGLRSAKGFVRLCLTPNPGRFPDCTGDPAAISRSLPASSSSTRFDGVPSGDYAVAIIHDENGNGRLDTFAGVPREGFGFSRNPKISFGPPRFDAASFAIGTAPVRQEVRIRYFL